MQNIPLAVCGEKAALLKKHQGYMPSNDLLSYSI